MKKGVKSILVPVNSSPHSEYAFRWACQVARSNKAQLHALHVIEVPLSLPLEAEITAEVDRAEELLSRYERIASDEKYRGLQTGCLRARQAGMAIVREVEIKRAEMIIVGIPYNRTLGQCNMGAAASHIFQYAPCQVILWRDPAPAPTFTGA